MDDMEPDIVEPDVTEPDIEVRDAPERHRFEILVDGQVAGHTAYRSRPQPLVRVFPHTEIDPAHQGRGLAGILIRGALDATRAAGLGVIPLCPAVRRYIARHPAYLDLVPADRRAEFDLPTDTA